MSNSKLQNEIDKMRKQIKTDSYPMSIGELANLYRDGDLNINPIYQRLFRWDIAQQSALIESILLGIPVPPIYVYQDGDYLQSLNLWEFYIIIRKMKMRMRTILLNQSR